MSRTLLERRTTARTLGVATVLLASVACAPPAAQKSQAASAPSDSAASLPSAATTLEPTPSSRSTPTTTTGSEWTQVAALGDGMGWDLATSVARGRDAFVAIGTRYVRAPEVIFAQPREYLWVSADGQTWDEVDIAAGLDGTQPGTRLVDVIATPDGGFVIVGMDQLTTLAWQSADGRDWRALDLNLGPDLIVGGVVQGVSGYLLGAYHVPTSDGSLWHSRDGVAWQEVQQFPAENSVVGSFGAGDEGFVAIGSRPGPDGQPDSTVFASADGLTWLEAPQPFGLTAETACFEPVMTPFGGDWIAVIALLDGSATVWSSANGLDWESVGSIANLGTTPCEPLALTYAGGRLLLSPSVAFHSLSSVVWSSTDGRTWKPWEPGADAAVIAAIDSPAGAVAVGAAVRGADASLASFWFRPTSSP